MIDPDDYAEVHERARLQTAADTVVALVRDVADDLGVDPNEALAVIDWSDLAIGPRGEVQIAEVLRRVRVFADTLP